MTTRLEARGSTLGTGEPISVVQVSRCRGMRQRSRATRVKLRRRQMVLSTVSGNGKLGAATTSARGAIMAAGRAGLSDNDLHPPGLAALDVEPAIHRLQLLPDRGGLEAAARNNPHTDLPVISDPKCQSRRDPLAAIYPNPRKRPPALARLGFNAAAVDRWPLLPTSDRPTLQDRHGRLGSGSHFFQADALRRGRSGGAEPECRGSRSLLLR
jgi:hypothetical protein